MTSNQIKAALRKAGKKVGTTRLYQYFNQFDIQPLGARQRPQQYPADAADRILRHLGFETAAAAPQGAINRQRRPVSLVSLPQLRAAKPRSTKKGTSK